MEASLSRNKGSYLKCSEIGFHNLGPFGGGGGFDCDDGNFEGINGITVMTSYIDGILLSIQVSYATGKDTTHTGPQHGGAGKEICTKFEYTTEKLQKISGYCGLVEGSWTVIKGLSFETNLAKYGPFGVADWAIFEFDLRSRDVVGVYGRACDRYLGSIGLRTLF
ncbi:agglutinin-like [Cryptomeria japonica]|uniref:agglutinin-like n=1 Tax=Cryptomeria japonica TaxID=3369 RepID=UPI0027DA9B77|nr:agglutinin-like [Cryptomeria japonica]